MNGPTVRAATQGDADEWLRLREALWPGEADLAPEVEAFLGGEPGASMLQAVFVAARPDGGLCGFAEVAVHPFADACEEAPCAYLEGLYVDDDARRGGVARALVAAVEAWARGQGFHELGSDYLIENTDSAAWHTAHGFDAVERLVVVRKRL